MNFSSIIRCNRFIYDKNSTKFTSFCNWSYLFPYNCYSEICCDAAKIRTVINFYATGPLLSPNSKNKKKSTLKKNLLFWEMELSSPKKLNIEETGCLSNLYYLLASQIFNSVPFPNTVSYTTLGILHLTVQLLYDLRDAIGKHSISLGIASILTMCLLT